MQKNIDDNDVEERSYPQHSTLFLRINKKENSTYEAILSLKSGGTSINQILETVQLNISEDLFLQVNSFQSLRRGVAVSIFRSGFETNLTENWEATLSEAIYQTFFSGEIGIICHDFLDKLQRNKIQELLLVISTEEERIQNLPWEIVLPKLNSDGDDGLPRNNFGLIRSREETWNQFDQRGVTEEYAPLKLLFIPALPEDLPERSKTLEIEKEQRKIIDAVRSLEVTGDQRPKLVMEILDCADLEEIKRSLRSNSHDIVHISGHGAYAEEIKAGILHLENEDGDEQKTTGHELGKVLKEFSSIKLVVLSACETAVGGTEGSTAEQIAAVGLPAVLAMRFSVSDEGAIRFSEKLYERLANGNTLTKAVHDARLRLWEDEMERQKNSPVNKRAEWFTPVLYQNQPIEALIKLGTPEQYNVEALNHIYPKLPFLKEDHTRLIGEGFIGRKRLLIQLRQLFKQCKHVCLHGLGGLGKTTTAEAFAERYRIHSGQDIIIFSGSAKIQESVILDEIYKRWRNRTNPNDVIVEELKDRLKDPNIEANQKLQLLIYNYLTGHPAILIFDNFEDLQTEADGKQQQGIVSESISGFIKYLLQNLPNSCQVLFTTRYHISGLEGLVTHLAIQKMTYAEQYRNINFSETLRQLSAEEREIVERRINGHPRALHFLERVLKKQTFDLAGFDAQLGEVEDEIFQDLLLERVFNQLDEAERDVFTVCSVFFSRTSLAALCAVVEKNSEELTLTLASLRDWSLCFWDETAQTFEVHALTRAWMKSQGQPEMKRFEQISQQAGIFFRERQSWEDKILAKEYFKQAEDWENYADVVFDLESHFRLIGLYSLARDLLLSILEKRIAPDIHANALNRLGIIDNYLGDFNKSLESLKLGLQLNCENEDKSGEGSSLNNIGYLYLEEGNDVKALEYLEQSLPIRRETKNRYGESVTLNNIGQVYLRRNQCVLAMKYFKDSLFIRRQIGDRVGEGNTLNNVGFTLEKASKYNRALKYLEESRRIRSDVGDKMGEGDSLKNIGQVYFSLKEYELALDYSNQSLTIYEQIGARSR